MMKNRLLIMFITTVVIIGIILAISYYYPKRIQFSAQGIQYQLGNEESDSVLTMDVIVDGKLIRKLNGDRVFQGSIDIPQLNLPIPEHAELMDVTLGLDYAGILIYSYIEQGRPFLYNVGRVFFSEQFDELTLLLTKYGGSGSWSQDDGMMLSTPAMSREQALEISNRLMKVRENNIQPLH